MLKVLMIGMALGWVSVVQAAQECRVGASPESLQPRYTITGRVVHVGDGDSFSMLAAGRSVKVRLASIDAPELGSGRRRPGQDMSRRSRQSLSALLAGKTFTLQCYEQDHYGRSICDVPLSDGDTANRRQVAAGMAWANMQGGGKYMRDARLCELEHQARQARAGLWQHPQPVQPWKWRYDCWKQSRC